MKFIRVRHLVTILTIFFCFSTATAQQFYVVVGAFAKESNAQKFTGYVRNLRYAAQYELNTAKNYYYVYVLKTSRREQASRQVKELQTASEFKDAWLFAGNLGNANDPVVETLALPDLPPDSIEAVQPIAVASPDSVIHVDTGLAVDSATLDLPEPRGKYFKFSIQTQDGRPVKGDVHVVDYRRGRELAAYRADKYVDVLPPSRFNNPMSVVCGIFGYKEVIKILDYGNPALEEGVVKDEKGAWVVPYTLERLKKGDVSVMYKVSFYKDAVVMLPPSQTELNELVTMMNDNPNYRIKIHGHCNGANGRRIIALGPTKNYFTVKGSDERNGSAKELSKLRAEAVQGYLADHGIEKARSEVFAWGALNMLVPETSNSAKLNDRIEIEILRD